MKKGEDAPVALRRHAEHLGAARFDLLDVADHLVEQRVLAAERHDQALFVYQRYGAVLQLAGRVGLRVDVRDLLELEGALHADGVVDVAADEEDRGVVEVEGGEILDVRPVVQNLLQLGGDQQQLGHNAVVLRLVQGAQGLGAVQADEVHHRKLGGEGLGGGHGDLRPRPGVQHVIRLPGDGGAHHIDDGQQARAQALGLPHGGQRVDGLSRLADHQGQGPVGDDGVTVAEL